MIFLFHSNNLRVLVIVDAGSQHKSNYVRKCLCVALQTFILFFAFKIDHYAIVDYINIDIFRIIQCQTCL